jgi:uncharacterized LabA/DUF88 family protein
MNEAARSTANVYVDGFNLYHGCFDDLSGRADWRQYRWLNLGAFGANYFPEFEIKRIRYFTALVSPTPDNPDCLTRQLTYIRALETIPNLTVHRGRFAVNKKRRLLADEQAPTPTALQPIQKVYVIEAEEKGSDVNLASYLLLDASRDEFDTAVVVSNDSDLAEPIRMVSREFGKNVVLVNPRKAVAADLQGIADKYKHIRIWVLRDSQFPDTFSDENGVITKPASWQAPVVASTSGT